MAEILLAGCAPIPLASYLKALGVFRLVAEQKDKYARGCWRNEAFVLGTTLTEEELVRFFLDEYRPSPIISPWNGRAGFLEGEDGEDSTRSGAELVRALQVTKAPRFKALKCAVEALLSLSSLTEMNTLRDQRKKAEARKKDGKLSDAEVEKLNALKKREGVLKARLITELRGTVTEEVVDWMDACWRIGVGEDAPPPAPLLGSGGNDGSRDLGVNFGQQLESLFDFGDAEGKPRPEAGALLRSAIFGTLAIGLESGTIGQFAPAQAGANAGVGFGEEAPLNSWDTVLSLEGSVSFAGAATRRLGGVKSESAFPFTVRATGAAGAASVPSDEAEARGEIWLPLWRNPASFSEIAALFAEGRATLRRRPVHDGVDFARAAASLGVSRGIKSFRRYGFVKREGRSFIAAPLGCIQVRRNAKADLLNDLDQGNWLQRFRDYARGKDASTRLQSLTLRLDEAIFTMTQDTSPRAIQRVLIAVGEATAYLVSSPKARDPKEGKQKPPPRLRSAWFNAADDGSAEFGLAAALAGLGRALTHAGEAIDEMDADTAPDQGAMTEEDEVSEDDPDFAESAAPGEEQRGGKISPPPLCAHLAPLDEKSWYRWRRKWSDKDALAVWGGGALARNLAAVIERRLLFAAARNLDGGAFDGRAPADLTSVLAFLAGDTDDVRIAALAQGLAWADAPDFVSTQAAQPQPLPLAYALLKPLFAPIEHVRALNSVPRDIRLPVPPGLIAQLRAGEVGRAVALACRRARASGLPVTFAPRKEDVAAFDGPRLLVSLLIPIREGDLRRVLERAYPALFNDAKTPMEDPAYAA